MFTLPTYQTVFLLVVLLAVIFVYLLGYTFWTRTKKKYWSRYKVKFRAMFAPLILAYIESAGQRSDADKVVNKLTRRSEDISLFLEVLDESTQILYGEDRKKLNWLIKHPLFDRFYRKKFYSSSSDAQLLACIYYAKSGYINKKMTVRLLRLSTSKNVKIAYSAAKVLQNSTNDVVRLNALRDFFKRHDATSLMAGELLHLYHHNADETYQGTGISLKKLLLQKDIPKERKQIIIDYIANHNLYEYSTFLLHYFQKILYRPENRSLIQSLISTLGSLRVIDAGPLIRSYSTVDDADFRITCVVALNHLGGEENLVFITNMIFDIEFNVRKQIIKTLVHDRDNGHLLLENFMLTYLKFISKVWTSDIPPNDLLVFMSKLRSITTGIRVMSANNSRQINPG